MAEYLGISRFCANCKRSHMEDKNIICDWKDGVKVNSIRCAPCFKKEGDAE